VVDTLLTLVILILSGSKRDEAKTRSGRCREMFRASRLEDTLWEPVVTGVRRAEKNDDGLRAYLLETWATGAWPKESRPTVPAGPHFNTVHTDTKE
jgi:hypothetical protein